jgi:hypothetical protein
MLMVRSVEPDRLLLRIPRGLRTRACRNRPLFPQGDPSQAIEQLSGFPGKGDFPGMVALSPPVALL